MAIVRPFRGIRYDPQHVDVSRVVAPPYDVIGSKDQQRYYLQDPHNVVRLIAGEVRPTDSAEDNKYLRAAGFFDAWLADGTLRGESQPAMYLYRHAFIDPTTAERKTRQGILGVVELEPFGTGILPHEQTHARAKADRLSLTRAVGANLSPIFALYDDPAGAIGTVVAAATGSAPWLDIGGEKDEHHAVWSITDHRAFQAIASVLSRSRLYIADGHHRYETALNFRNKMRAEHPDAPPDAAFNYVLMLLVDVNDPGLTILPTHRIVHDVADFDAAALLRALRDRYQVTDQRDPAGLIDAMRQPVSDHRIGVALDHGLLTVDIPRAAAANPVSELDVSVLHDRILQSQLGLGDELVEAERHLSYSRDLEAVLERVESGTAQAGFLLRPPAVSDVVAVARAGQVMPQKSTYFYPKPASGIVFNPLDPAIQIPAV
jgi:uncharacterized protein (DUF1015 family)